MRKKYLFMFNFFSVILVISYVFAFFSTYLSIKSNYNYYESTYATMIASASDLNASTNNSSNNGKKINETPLANNASDIIDIAWNNLQSASCYEYQIVGTVTVKAGPVTKVVQANVLQLHYDDGSVLDEIRLYDTQSTANQTGSSACYYVNGKVYGRRGTITKVNSDGTMEVNYSTEFKHNRDQDAHHSYIICKDTIIKELYFNINYNMYTGKLESYSASVNLNTTKSIKGYDLQVQKNGGLDSLPIFSNIEAHCLIDSNGTMNSLTIKETYSSKIVYGIKMDYESYSVFNMSIKNVNGTLSIEKPVIN